jgi:hypothetical protein
MVPMTELWLPIVIATVLVFLASALIWTVLNVHKHEWAPLPAEDRIVPALREATIRPGQYYFPAAKMTQGAGVEGPSGYVYVDGPGATDMRRSIAYAILFNLVIALTVAYLAGRTLEPGEAYLAVFRVVGTVALLAYGAAHFTYAIWFSHAWSAAWKHLAEAIVYAGLMAGVFGWLWPS